MTLNRRALFTGLGAALIVAPAIVRVESLMRLPPRPRVIRAWVDIQEIRDRNVLLMVANYENRMRDIFHDIPICVVDELTPKEGLVECQYIENTIIMPGS